MVAAGKKAKHLSLVKHTTNTINYSSSNYLTIDQLHYKYDKALLQ